jgi:hypothetical protein
MQAILNQIVHDVMAGPHACHSPTSERFFLSAVFAEALSRGADLGQPPATGLVPVSCEIP